MRLYHNDNVVSSRKPGAQRTFIHYSPDGVFRHVIYPRYEYLAIMPTIEMMNDRYYRRWVEHYVFAYLNKRQRQPDINFILEKDFKSADDYKAVIYVWMMPYVLPAKFGIKFKHIFYAENAKGTPFHLLNETSISFYGKCGFDNENVLQCMAATYFSSPEGKQELARRNIKENANTDWKILKEM